MIALHDAALRGSAVTVASLLAADADPNKGNRGVDGQVSGYLSDDNLSSNEFGGV